MDRIEWLGTSEVELLLERVPKCRTNLIDAQLGWAELNLRAFYQFQIDVDGLKVGSCDENKRAVAQDIARRLSRKLSTSERDRAF